MDRASRAPFGQVRGGPTALLDVSSTAPKNPADRIPPSGDPPPDLSIPDAERVRQATYDIGSQLKAAKKFLTSARAT